jgi:hypothetical protein
VRSRILRTPEAPITVLREGFFCPRSIAPASRTLSSSSSNISLFISEFPFDNFGELGYLLRSQIRRDVLGIGVKQQNQIPPYRPVVDDARTAALTPRPNPYSDLPNSGAAFDEGTQLRIRSDSRVKLTVLFVCEQSRDLLRKRRSLDQLLKNPLSATGG